VKGFTTLTSSAFTVLARELSPKAACRLLGVSRATHDRRQQAPVLGPARAPGSGVQPIALGSREREQILQSLNSDRFADKSPAQAWAVLIDEGCGLASISTFYRVLRAADQERLGLTLPPGGC
jgi:hypothetical protein